MKKKLLSNLNFVWSIIILILKNLTKIKLNLKYFSPHTELDEIYQTSLIIKSLSMPDINDFNDVKYLQ